MRARGRGRLTNPGAEAISLIGPLNSEVRMSQRQPLCFELQPNSSWRYAMHMDLVFLFLVFAGSVALAASDSSKGALQIYFVDVEGGQATLFVTPAGQSLLIDTGWPGNEDRD